MRRVLSILLCAVLVLSLAACGDKKKSEDGREDETNNTASSPSDTESSEELTSSSDAESLEELTSSSDTEPTETSEETDPNAISKEEFKQAFTGLSYEVINMHSYGEDVDDDLFNKMGTSFFGEGNEGAALSQLLKKYCPTMIEAFDALDDEAKDEFFNSDIYSSDSILSVNLDDVYNEFKSLQEDLAAQRDQEQQLYASFNIPDVTDNVLYDEDGVKVTYTGANFKDYSESGRCMNFTVHISNQNPDNKKATVVLDYAALNGLTVIENGVDFSDLYVADGNYDVLAGEERDLTFEDTSSMSVETYMQRLSLLGESTDTLPVETLSFAYTIRVGKDAEWEARIAELKTSEYRDGDLDGLFGTCVAEGTESSENIGIYVKTGEFGVTVVAVNNRRENLEPASGVTWSHNDGSTYSNNGQVLFNGNDITDYLFTEVETTYNGMNSLLSNAVHPGQASILLSMDFNEDVIGNLRRQYEVGNSEPVEITLNYLEDRLGQPIPAVIYSE